MNIKTVLLSLLVFIASVSYAAKPINVKGQMAGLKGKLYLKLGTAAESLSRDYQEIKVDKEGFFKFKFNVDAPRVVTLGKIQFFAIPGTSIEIIEIKGERGRKDIYSFRGDHSLLNHLVNSYQFSIREGSYCAKKFNINKYKDLDSFVKYCDDMKNGFEEDFKRVESKYDAYKKRLKEDNDLHYNYSLVSYPDLLGLKDNTKEKLDLRERISYHISPSIRVYDENNPVHRDAYSTPLFLRNRVTIFANARLEDYAKASQMIAYINTNGANDETLIKVNAFIKACSNKSYKDIVQSKYKKFNIVKVGKTPSDFEFKTTNGRVRHLKEFKGKTIVIDLWATWCHPCMQQKPVFAEIAEKYANKKNVVFLAISTDSKEDWNNYVEDHKDKNNLIVGNAAWSIVNKSFVVPTIPRFIVIDKDFKFSTPFAPMPSSDKLEKFIID
jgi:thiol-disulfide isomerase/thioredoxin